MKKSLAILAVAALSAASYAQTNTVSSANVIGYIQITDPASNKLALISAPFNCGTGTVSTLQDILGTNQLRQSFLPTRGDMVITWDVVQQQYIRYVQKTNGLFYAFTNFSGSAINPTITRGQALWIQAPVAAYAPTNKIIYISGDVPDDNQYINSVAGNAGAPFNFIANPYPVEMDINSLINTNDGATGSFLPTRADKVTLWDNSAQQYIRLALKTPTNQWFYFTNFSATVAPVIKIQPGQGFWYQTTNSFNWIETQPYNLQQ